MPLYEYECPSGHRMDKLFKYESRPTTVPCGCGLSAHLIVSMPMRTPGLWGDSASFFVPELNTTVRNHSEMERVAEKQGLVYVTPEVQALAEKKLDLEVRKREADRKELAAMKKEYDSCGDALLANTRVLNPTYLEQKQKEGLL